MQSTNQIGLKSITIYKEGVAVPMKIFPKVVADKLEKSKLQN